MSKPVECKSKEGVLIGLLDSIMTVATVAAERLRRMDTDDMRDEIGAALEDLYRNRALRFLMSFNGNLVYGDEPEHVEFKAKMSELKRLFPPEQMLAEVKKAFPNGSPH
jgi:hypothetical protein